MAIIKALFSAIFIFAFLIEFLSPSREVKTPEPITTIEEPIIDDELLSMGNFYNVQAPSENKKLEKSNNEIWLPKIVNIFANSDIGFIIFYSLIFATLFLQLFYFYGEIEISFLAVDFNLQAPPMLGVGGTIYALVNSDISGSTSIIQTLTAILLGAGLTTLLGIFVFIINHFLTRYIKFK